MPELTDHEINLAIARRMPWWVECKIGQDAPGHIWTEYPEARRPHVEHWIGEVYCGDWSPATDLNQAAEAVRAICDCPTYEGDRWILRNKWVNALSAAQGGLTFYTAALAGPRAWCLALLAMENANG